MTGQVLEVTGLRTEFAGRASTVTAVRDVDLTIRRGERVGLVGESGSGKSAFALSVLGLIEPPGRVAEGAVVLNGRDLRTLSERQLGRVRGREVSLVFQDPMTALDPVKNIGSQIVEAIRQHQSCSKRAARRRAVELLHDVELPDAERRLGDYPHQFSGGMRQRVVIAIALANDPDLIIADEPTTALDVTTQAQILDLLQRAVDDRGTAVLLITHDLAVVQEFCSSVAVMYAGRIVERAPTASLLEAPAHPYTAALLTAVPRPGQTQERLATIPGSPPDLANLPSGCAFAPRCPRGSGVAKCLRVAPAQIRHGESIAECHFPDGARVGSDRAPRIPVP